MVLPLLLYLFDLMGGGVSAKIPFLTRFYCRVYFRWKIPALLESLYFLWELSHSETHQEQGKHSYSLWDFGNFLILFPYWLWELPGEVLVSEDEKCFLITANNRLLNIYCVLLHCTGISEDFREPQLFFASLGEIFVQDQTSRLIQPSRTGQCRESVRQTEYAKDFWCGFCFPLYHESKVYLQGAIP